MKYVSLIWAGLWRRRLPTILTQLSVVVAFFLFGILQRVDFAFTRGVNSAGLDVLHVQPKYRGLLPVSYLDRIRKVPGVSVATPRVGVEGYYREPRNSVNGLAVDPAGYFAVHREYRIAATELRALERDRIGAAVTAAAATAYGWKLGDRVSFHSSVFKKDGTYDWPVDIVAIFTVPQSSGLKGVLFRYDYFDTARSSNTSTVDQFLVRARSAEGADAVGRAIDRAFANSAHETHTIAEKEIAQAVLKQFGDLEFFTKAIVTAVFFTLLFLTVSTTTQSVRERTPEFAVLKTIGYSDQGVFGLLIAESVLLCLIPALIGLVGTIGLFALVLHFFGSLFGMASLPATVVVQGIGISILIALATGLPPALRLNRMRIADCLAGR